MDSPLVQGGFFSIDIGGNGIDAIGGVGTMFLAIELIVLKKKLPRGPGSFGETKLIVGTVHAGVDGE